MVTFSKPKLCLKAALLAGSMLAATASAFAQDTQPVDEIVVRGRNIPDPQRNTSEIVSVLRAEDLKRAADTNAALALTRLSGLSVVNGRFVYVRGLGDRYSSALLNGSPLPSPEPLRRQVPLDLFPSNILESAVVQKTFSPDYPGEFGGGVINLKTLKTPDEGFLHAKIGTGANFHSTLKDGLVYEGTGSDWTTFGGSLRNIPDAIEAGLQTGKILDSANFTDAQLETFGESLVNSPFTVIQSQTQEPDFKGELSAGKTFSLTDAIDIGVVGVVGYDTQRRSFEAVRQVAIGSTVASDFIVDNTNWDTVLNGFLSATAKTDNHSVTLTGFLVRSTQKKAQIAEGNNASQPSGVDSLHREATAWYERQLASFQISGDHDFGPLAVQWRTSVAESRRDAPYERDITYTSTAAFPFYYQQIGINNKTVFSYLNDQIFSAGIDAQYTIPLSDYRDAVFSAGFAYSKSDRDYTNRQFAFEEPSSSVIPDSVRVSRPDFLFQPDNIGGNAFRFVEFTGRDNSYDAGLGVKAAYVAADVEILPLVHVSAGVRYEDASERVRTLNFYGATPFAPAVQLDNDYFLPGATVTWNFADDLLVRAGYSKTIARPQFRELAFSSYVDPETDRQYFGNPFLVDSKFNNYDLRLEYYFGRSQYVTFAGFYKDITNPIEEVVIPREDGDTTTRFINAPGAKLFGGEAEYRIKFEMPWDVPVIEDENWLFSVNYTYTHSEVNGTSELIASPLLLPNRVLVPASDFALDGTRLQGSPTHIVNAQFGWEAPHSQTTLLLGFVSNRIDRRGLGSLPNVIEKPGTIFDVVHKQDLVPLGGDHYLKLEISARNLLNARHQEFQLAPAPLGRTETNTYVYGRTVSVGLAVDF